MKLLWRWLWRRRAAFFVVAGYVVVVLAIMLPWFAPGFILTTDMVFASPMPMPSEIHSGFLFYAALHWVSLVLPADVLQKILLSAIFLLSGWSARILTRAVIGRFAPASTAFYMATFAAGLFYMVNPFLYSRLMAGQFAFLLADALLPLVLYFFWNLCLKPSFIRALQLGVLLTALSIPSLHIFGMAIGILFIGCAVLLWRQYYQPQAITNPLRWFCVSIVVWIVLSSYWLWPLLTGNGKEISQLASFTSSHAETFQTLGGIASVLLLQGFWADRHSLYLMPQDLYEGWWLPLLFLLPLLLLGFIALWQRARLISVWLAAVLFIAGPLAAGVTDHYFGGMNSLLYDIIPFYGGYRDAQKFVALIAMVYAVILGAGIWWLLSHFKPWAQIAGGVVAIALPMLYAPLLFFGGSGQLQSCDYPRDWYLARAMLRADGSRHRSLFLPWHLYMPYSFTKHTIASPGQVFFGASVYVSTNPEVGSLQRESSDSAEAQIAKNLIMPYDASSFATNAARLQIKYIIVAKSYDYKKYQFLQNAPGLKIIQNTSTIMVYKNLYRNKRNAASS